MAMTAVAFEVLEMEEFAKAYVVPLLVGVIFTLLMAIFSQMGSRASAS